MANPTRVVARLDVAIEESCAQGGLFVENQPRIDLDCCCEARRCCRCICAIAAVHVVVNTVWTERAVKQGLRWL